MEGLAPTAEADLLDLTIRFSASLPDLLVTVPNPTVSTTATLTRLIRAQLPSELANRRIRLIYAGKSLEDFAMLSSSLRLPPSRVPSGTSTPVHTENGGSGGSSSITGGGKGKSAVRDPPALSRIYIHCSIGDVVLSATELAAEALLAAPPSQKTGSGTASGGLDTYTPSLPPPITTNTTTTTPAPRGFDRLLSAGFTPAEVLALRSQFLAIQAHTHTPDAMPSPSTLRDMEDQWLDNSNAEDGRGGPGGGGGFADDEGQAGALDDMLWGAVMGFFWPVGCLWWLCREEGAWTRRRRLAVFIGVVVNAGFGGVRWLK